MSIQWGLPLLLGIGGWYSARWLKVPAAPVLGPMLLVGVAGCLGLAGPPLPAWTKFWLQVTVGVFLGYRLDPAAFRGHGAMVKPMALAAVWPVLSALAIGYLLAHLTDIDPATAFLGTTPGGIAEMSALGVSVGANVALVATLQAFRLISSLVLVPLLARRMSAGEPETRAATVRRAMPAGPARTPSARGWRSYTWPLWFALGALGSYAFARLHVPGGSFVGAMAVVAALRVARFRLPSPPMMLRTGGQIGMGILIGMSFGTDTIAQLRVEFVPILVATLGTLVSGLILAGVVRSALNTDPQTALLACAPAGVVQMVIVADEMGAEVLVVTLFQLARLMTCVSVMPLLFSLLV